MKMTSHPPLQSFFTESNRSPREPTSPQLNKRRLCISETCSQMLTRRQKLQKMFSSDEKCSPKRPLYPLSKIKKAFIVVTCLPRFRLWSPVPDEDRWTRVLSGSGPGSRELPSVRTFSSTCRCPTDRFQQTLD